MVALAEEKLLRTVVKSSARRRMQRADQHGKPFSGHEPTTMTCSMPGALSGRLNPLSSPPPPLFVLMQPILDEKPQSMGESTPPPRMKTVNWRWQTVWGSAMTNSRPIGYDRIGQERADYGHGRGVNT
jgi:hypothetical protein